MPDATGAAGASRVPVVRPGEAPLVEWRPGVRTRLHATDAAAPEALCVIEQWCAPGSGAPTHTHREVEEVVTVIAGEAEVWVGETRTSVSAGDSVVFPPQSWHGFRNTGAGELHVLGIFAADRPPVVYAEEPGVVMEIGGRGPRMHDPHRALRDGPP